MAARLPRILFWIIALPLALAATLFAISNRQAARLDLWPLPFSLDVPTWLAVLAPLAAGLLAGMVLAWAAGGRSRRRGREFRRRAEAAERELERLRGQAPAISSDIPAPTGAVEGPLPQ